MSATLVACAWLCAPRVDAQEGLPKHLFGTSDTAEMNRWADSVYRAMSPRQRLAQLIMPIVYPSDDEGRIRAEELRVQRHQWGGILYQRGLLHEQATMDRRLQQASATPMLIALDGEWGLFMRLKDAPRYPRNMGLGMHADEQLLYNYGREVARQCRLMGIQVNFAPTIDVNINPKNPVIGTRSFGDDPKAVARMSLAYAQGLEDGGVLSVAKHFPGHGDTSEDSHKTLPVVSADKVRMARVELYPFEQYIREGFGGIMTAHLRVPAYEPRPIPSSLSPAIVTDLLQVRMGFGGLIFTDGLEMKGVHGSGMGNIGVAALKAGNDILLGPPSAEAQLDALVEAYQSGQLDHELIRLKVMKVLYYKWRLIVREPDLRAPASSVRAQIAPPEERRLNAELWQASLYHARVSPQIQRGVASGQYKRIAVVQVGKNPISMSIPSRLPGGVEVRSFTWSGGTPALAELKGYDLVLVNAFSTAGVPTDMLARLSAERPVVLAYYTSPYKVRVSELPRAIPHVIVAIEAAREAQEAVLAYVSGQSVATSARESFEADGEDPTALMTAPPPPPNPVATIGYKRQLSPQGLSRIESIVREGLDSKAFPGCQVYVMHRGREVYARAWGLKSGAQERELVDLSTIYDLASITKALATTPALMLLVGDGRIQLDAPAERYLTELRGSPVGRISVRSLLLHESGLPAGIPFYTDLIDSESVSEGVLSEGNAIPWRAEYISTTRDDKHPLTFASGLYVSPAFREVMLRRISSTTLRGAGRYRYSDVGFVLLHQIVERVSGEPLDELLQRRVYEPIGARLYFNPLSKGVAPKTIAPTQYDGALRHQTIRGTVDDETAACLGGVSGNAGLYGSARELAKVAQLLLAGGRYEGRQIIPERVVKLFITTTGVGGRRALGFDKPTRQGTNPAADSASPRTVGHFGFTGTAFWIDPDEELVFVFLSNRTYPTRANTRLAREKYRPRLHQAVYDALK